MDDIPFETAADVMRRYPTLFTEDPEKQLPSGFRCKGGWMEAIEDTLRAMDQTVRDEGLTGVRVTSIAEKFGSLRISVEGASDTILELSHQAARQTARLCECCGGPSSLKDLAGWYSTVCDKCYSQLYPQFATLPTDAVR